ncbi:MAG: acetyl-CoA carboxylase biotin carboxylase subunit [Elusimicrobia bacterium RIFCSPLOWO2_01_FULL_59_12]|nr:MAG: acetyl-CoA carboxylase biotin carboxylase subunit [Elusimicrobia bacterium RIFCSPLOWO2_01_FULL_59_12]
MFKKVLIANRGEIAVRVIRACRELGLKTVAVHSEPDKSSLHVKLADESVCIGPGLASESYLNIPNIISAAEISGADAIHPGYGFLSENPYFADVCESCHIHFIGPSKEAIEKMGDKAAARETMRNAGVPIIPGSDGCISAEDPNLTKIARKVGYPLIVKACAGGGGKGLRVIQNEDALIDAIRLVETEAKAAFGSGQVYLERYLEKPRHIEIQILADHKGKVIYLPERECSIQRRHQKLIEESPSTAVDSSMRKKMGKAAHRAAEAVDYVTVGTVEFLYDEKEEEFYFLEMNTRIQVEHTVTEMVTGLDLVKEQIRLAAGERLEYDRDDIPLLGHSIECRINAEDPDHDFRPSPGTLTQVILPGPPGVRVDTHIYSGYTIPTYYDSLLAKLVVMGVDRPEAIRRMQRALSEFTIEGVKTTLPLHQKIVAHELFLKGETYTDFVAKNIYGNSNGNGIKR